MSKLHTVSPLDNLFLLAETVKQPMHVGCLLLYKASDTQETEQAASAAARTMLSCDEAVAPFNYRLVKRWGLPMWQEAERLNITQHVRHIRLPADSCRQDLNDLVATLHSSLMDRSLPLWRVWIISGLAENRYAMYWQMHHALLDGVSGMRMIAQAHASDPNQRDMPPYWAPASGSVFRSAAVDGAVQGAWPMLAKLLRSQAQVSRGLIRNWWHEQSMPYTSGMFHAPKSVLNDRISASRCLATGSFSLPRVRAIGSRLQATVNDVLLMSTGRALQRYLQQLDALPDAPLRTLIPVSLRAEDSIGGNEVGFMRVSMGTHLMPIEQLVDAVKSSVSQQKKVLQPMDKEGKQLYTFSLLAPMLSHVATGRMGRYRTANVLLSNIPGPKQTLYWNGLELDALYPVSMPLHECGVNFTVLSYRDRLQLGIVSCPTRVARPQQLLDGLEEALAEIEAYAERLVSVSDVAA